MHFHIFFVFLLCLRCNSLCLVINFLDLWSICLSSFLVHLKNGLVYPTRGNDQVFIALMRFYCWAWFWSTSWFVSAFLCLLSLFPSSFPSFKSSLCILDLVILILIIILVSHYYHYIYFLRVFSHQRYLMVFHGSLSDSKSPQVSRTLLSILAVLNNAVVWMVSTCPPTSKSSSPFSNPLVTVPNAPITIGIIVTFMFHSFFDSLARSWYLSFFSHSFSFILCSVGTAKLSTILQVLFLLIIIRSGLLAEIWWSVCMSKPHRSSCVLFSRTGAGLCIYHFLVFKFKFLAHLPVDHLADPSVLICCIRLLCDWYYYYLTPFRVFFPPSFTDGSSLEFEWQ